VLNSFLLFIGSSFVETSSLCLDKFLNSRFLPGQPGRVDYEAASPVDVRRVMHVASWSGSF